MILLCDEDIGTGVPTSLRLVGYNTVSAANQGWLGVDDHLWLPTAGKNGWLVLSSNKKMLEVPIERQAIIDNKVGIVFLTTGEEYVERVLWLLLVKWKKLEELDQGPRPFARFLSPTGHWSDSYKRWRLT